MTTQIGISEVRRHLSRFVAAVQFGEEFVITKRGRPVARLVAFAGRIKLARVQKAALQRLFASALPLGIKKWRREDLYENL